jgi:hypothetical protein
VAQEQPHGGNIDPAPFALQVNVHPSGGGSNLNGVFEPGETVQIEPAWRNPGLGGYDLTGTASQFVGPPGATYSILDSAASYAPPPLGASSCYVDGLNCYVMSVDNPAQRPAAHWDATFSEVVSGVGVIGGETWTLHIGESFPDVLTSNIFYPFVENVFHNGVTGGCGAGNYCPSDLALRRQMAVLVLKAKEGASYVPPPAMGIFADVPPGDPFAPWIEELYNRGVVAGCGPGPTYCPDDPVLREQAAVYLLKTLLGSGYVPPPCQGIFSDVSCSISFAPWIEDLFTRQITAGCRSGTYCPTDPVTREEIAPFLVKTFGLLLYGP